MADTIERNPVHPDALTMGDLTDGRRIIFVSASGGHVDSAVYRIRGTAYEFSERNESPLTNPGPPREGPGPMAVNYVPDEGRGLSTIFLVDCGVIPFVDGTWSDRYILDAPPEM